MHEFGFQTRDEEWKYKYSGGRVRKGSVVGEYKTGRREGTRATGIWLGKRPIEGKVRVKK